MNPLFDDRSTVLILGSLPGKKSLEKNEYYCDSRNHFWDLICYVCEERVLFNNYDEKKAFLSKHHIALWDVLKAAEREGSKDENIKNGEFNNLDEFIRKYNIKVVCLNGGKANKLFIKYLKENNFKKEKLNYEIVPLTSSSQRNRWYSLHEKQEKWKEDLSAVIEHHRIFSN